MSDWLEDERRLRMVPCEMTVLPSGGGAPIPCGARATMTAEDADGEVIWLCEDHDGIEELSHGEEIFPW